MTDDLTIRPFTAADQPAVRALILAGLADHFGELDETMNPDLDDLAAHYADGTIIVAEFNGRIVGTGTLIQEEPGVGRLVRMSVDRETRGRGIGRTLVQQLIGASRARGDSRLLVETNEDWEDAIGLYRSCGFTEFDRRDGEIHMELDPREGNER